MKKDIFVSLVLDISAPMDTEAVARFAALLEQDYSSHEILLCDRNGLMRNSVGKLLAQVQGVRYMLFSGELSDEVSLAAGLENAIGDIIVLASAGNVTEDAVRQGVELCCSGHDLVAGSGGKGTGIPLILRPVAGLIGYKQCPGDTGLRIVSRRLAISAMTPANFHHTLYYRLARAAEGIEPLRYACKARLHMGFRDIMRTATYTSTSLLRLVNGIALCTSFIALLVAGYTVGMRLWSKGVIEGWTTTMFTLSFFFVVLFLVLTVLGEYLMRIIVLSTGTSAYHVVQERHSSVMLDATALNVKAESDTPAPNLTQTGRDR